MSIKIENVEVMGWEAAIRGMRNPMNSWEKSDSSNGCDTGLCKSCGFKPDWCGNTCRFIIGPNDLDLMKRLRNAGTEHRKFMRMITVYVDITAPLYWWKEFDTYKIGTVANSCSTMHKIHAKEFTLEDFSCEHLCKASLSVLNTTIEQLNWCRESYLKSKDKGCWWQMIQLLPSSYNQKRTVMLNYEVLAAMYHQRKNHKLDEWREFCRWIETLPYSELITGSKKED
jgi:hypothetical protein